MFPDVLLNLIFLSCLLSKWIILFSLGFFHILSKSFFVFYIKRLFLYFLPSLILNYQFCHFFIRQNIISWSPIIIAFKFIKISYVISGFLYLSWMFLHILFVFLYCDRDKLCISLFITLKLNVLLCVFTMLYVLNIKCSF